MRGAGDPVPDPAGALREVTMPLRPGETRSGKCTGWPRPQDQPPTPGRLFWPLCEWKAPTGDIAPAVLFGCVPAPVPTPQGPGSTCLPRTSAS